MLLGVSGTEVDAILLLLHAMVDSVVDLLPSWAHILMDLAHTLSPSLLSLFHFGKSLLSSAAGVGPAKVVGQLLKCPFGDLSCPALGVLLHLHRSLCFSNALVIGTI